MKINKVTSRDKKNRKRAKGMRVSGRSVFGMQAILVKRAEKAKEK
jgi:hypothetical protein